jgi:hypothetical protein
VYGVQGHPPAAVKQERARFGFSVTENVDSGEVDPGAGFDE